MNRVKERKEKRGGGFFENALFKEQERQIRVWVVYQIKQINKQLFIIY